MPAAKTSNARLGVIRASMRCGTSEGDSPQVIL